MKTKLLPALLLAIAPAAGAQSTGAQSPAGLWDATITFNGQDHSVPPSDRRRGIQPQRLAVQWRGQSCRQRCKLSKRIAGVEFRFLRRQARSQTARWRVGGQYGPMLKKTFPVDGASPYGGRQLQRESSVYQRSLGSGREKFEGRAGLASDRSAEERHRMSKPRFCEWMATPAR